MKKSARFEARRAKIMERIPEGYSGTLHVLWFNLLGLGIPRLCLAQLNDPGLADWLFVPGFLVFTNFFEWWYHKGPLHHRWEAIPDAYQKHTLEHHAAYVEDDMAIREPRELYHVLFAWDFVPKTMLALSPLPLVLGTFGGWNLFWLFYASAAIYYLAYEWLHTIHHLPLERWLGAGSRVQTLRRHHARHHDPRWMSKGNFNISFPLWDWILGTTVSDEQASAAGVSRASRPQRANQPA